MVQVYGWDGSTTSWVARDDALTGRNRSDQFGSSVGLSADGNILIVSEPTYDGNAGSRSGGVRIFVWSESSGRYQVLGQQLEGGADDHFGISVSISQNGRRLIVGAPYANGEVPRSGQVTVFELSDNGSWVMLGNPISGTHELEWFGWNVDISDDGSLVAIGAPRNSRYGGYVNCYVFEDGNWKQLGDSIVNSVEPLRYNDNFGHVVRLSGNRRIAIGSPFKNRDGVNTGVVVVYEFDDGTEQWNQLGNEISHPDPRGDDLFGSSVDLRGDILVVGIPGRRRRGQVDFFQYDSATTDWVRHQDSLEGKDGSNFGFSVCLTDSFLAVGSAVTKRPKAGSVSVYSQT